MKHILFTLCLATLLVGMSSCAPYGNVYAGGGYRSGYVRPSYGYARPGYVRPSYGWANRSYGRTGYYSSRPQYRPSSYRSSPYRNGGQHHHSYNRSGWSNAGSRSRGHAGPVRLSNANWHR